MVPAGVLATRALTKVYGAQTALHPTDFRLAPGEVRALVGSNGAGKSTLMKILAGAVAPSGGTVEIDGTPAPLGRPTAMLERGVACIYQHSNLVPEMSALDNLFLRRPPAGRLGLLDRRRQRAQAQALLARYEIELDLDVPAGRLPTVKQKQIEILKALALDARVLLMDEPTGWLSLHDVEHLHATMRGLRARGVAIVYTSHLLDEVFAVCDTVTVMRDGRVVADVPVAALDRTELVRLMVGEAMTRQIESGARRAAAPAGVPRLRCRGLSRRGAFEDIGFDLHAGEILCITGLVGAGRSEVLHALFGAQPPDAGQVELDGRAIRPRSPRDAIALGIGLLTEDRHRDGLLPNLSLAENLILATLRRYGGAGLLLAQRVRAAAARWIAALNIQPPLAARVVRQLSGGNQQKVLLARWLDMQPRVLMLDEPTVGVDVGAKAEICARLRDERDAGMAILIVSSDLEEVLAIADRVLVMAEGRIVWSGAVHETGAGHLVRLLGGAAA